jgi:hypothetical protein
MIRSLLLIGSLAFQSVCVRAAMPEDTLVLSTWHFAISLAGNTEGQLFSMFLIKLSDDSLVLETAPLTRNSFIRQVQGRTFSKANPDGEDLFRKYGVKQCTLSEDSAQMGFLTDCSTLDDLWRLRFQSYPIKLSEGLRAPTGWAANALKPDDRQMLLLSDYGMKFPIDLIIGENLFRLLRDMADPEWVDNYRKGE